MATKKKVGRPSTAHLSPLAKARMAIEDSIDIPGKYKTVIDLYEGIDHSKCLMMYSKKCKDKNGHNKTSEYYSVHSTMFDSHTAPICKECVKEYCSNEDGSINTVKLLQVLPILDKPYRKDFIDIAEKSKKPTKVAEYLRVCSFPQNAHLTFSDSDGTFSEVESDARNRQDPLEIEVTPEMKIKWGANISEADVKFLQYTFERYISYYSVNVDDPVQSGLVEDLCHQDLKIRKARETNKPEKDYISAKQDLLKTANLSPSQTAKTNTGFSIGGWIKEREENMPISEPKDEFKDVDGIYKVFTKFFGHIVKMMGLNKNGFEG